MVCITAVIGVKWDLVRSLNEGSHSKYKSSLDLSSADLNDNHTAALKNGL